ncbi:unnamed protein product [Caenorhabditis sp. 36 PRJEB53466]|nr:unnamed protein product [Caenorhabditis sp. 36 PRJEB53466]
MWEEVAKYVIQAAWLVPGGILNAILLYTICSPIIMLCISKNLRVHAFSRSSSKSQSTKVFTLTNSVQKSR